MDNNILEGPNVLNESVSDVPLVNTNPVTTDTVNTNPEDVALVLSNQSNEHLSAPQGDVDGQLVTADTDVSIPQGDNETGDGINQDTVPTQETDSGIFSRDVDVSSRLRTMSHDDVATLAITREQIKSRDPDPRQVLGVSFNPELEQGPTQPRFKPSHERETVFDLTTLSERVDSDSEHNIGDELLPGRNPFAEFITHSLNTDNTTAPIQDVVPIDDGRATGGPSMPDTLGVEADTTPPVPAATRMRSAHLEPDTPRKLSLIHI